MKQFFVKWIVNTLALLIVVNMTSAISVSNWSVLLVTALILGLLNAFLKPLIIIITLPINILSLGFFTFVVNGLMFYLVSKLVAGFYITSFWGAVWGALLFGITSFFLNLFIGGSKVKVAAHNFNHSGARPQRTQRDNVIDVEIVEKPEDNRKLGGKDSSIY